MIFKCEWLFIVIVLVSILIQECFGFFKQSEENGENSISYEDMYVFGSPDIIREQLLSGTRTSNSLNEIDGNFKEIARKKNDKEESLMDKILPMLILPFLVSSSMIPGMLLSIKFLMIKSAVIGKIALVLMLLSFFRRRTSSGGGVSDHYPTNLAQEHYGYHGVAEPGVYVNRRKRRRKRRQLR